MLLSDLLISLIHDCFQLEQIYLHLEGIRPYLYNKFLLNIKLTSEGSIFIAEMTLVMLVTSSIFTMASRESYDVKSEEVSEEIFSGRLRRTHGGQNAHWEVGPGRRYILGDRMR